MKHVITFLLLTFMVVACGQVQTGGQTWTEQSAEQWYNTKTWLGGLKLQPHESINKLELAIQYHKNKQVWDLAFAYLRDHDLTTLPVGKYFLDPVHEDWGWVTVSTSVSKDLKDTKLEAHRKYIDIQHVVSGGEQMGMAPLSSATVTEPYSETREVGFFTSPNVKFYVAKPDEFFIFFPSDAHEPSVKTDGPTDVKKVVIKVQVAE